jgi:hypothetical protein
MNIKQAQNEIVKREGGKSNIIIGDVREVIGHLSDLMFEDSTLVAMLIANGARRAKRKKK